MKKVQERGGGGGVILDCLSFVETALVPPTDYTVHTYRFHRVGSQNTLPSAIILQLNASLLPLSLCLYHDTRLRPSIIKAIKASQTHGFTVTLIIDSIRWSYRNAGAW